MQQFQQLYFFWDENSLKIQRNRMYYSVSDIIITATPSKTNLNDYEGPHVKTVCNRKNMV